MRKLLLIISLLVSIVLVGCEKNNYAGGFGNSTPAQTERVMLGGVNIAGTWTNTEYPNDIGWYWKIDETHISYYEPDDAGTKRPSFKNGYIYNNGNNWILEMYPEYDIVDNSIFVS